MLHSYPADHKHLVLIVKTTQPLLIHKITNKHFLTTAQNTKIHKTIHPAQNRHRLTLHLQAHHLILSFQIKFDKNFDKQLTFLVSKVNEYILFL